MGILIAVVVIAGVLGWIIVKNDELSGLGRTVRPGSFRSPHGKLVHVKALGEIPAEEPWSRRFKRAFPLVSCVVFFVLLVVQFAFIQSAAAPDWMRVLDWVLNSPVPAAVIAGEALIRLHDGLRPLPTYVIALLCAFVMQAVLIAVFSVVAWLISLAGLAGAAVALMWTIAMFASPFTFALGAALVVARTGKMVKFRRRFADGFENEIEVSTNSVAYGAYRELMGNKAAGKAAVAKGASDGAEGNGAEGFEAAGAELVSAEESDGKK